MKKLIGITIVVSLLSSCGLTFGDYDHYQEVYGNKQCCAKTAQDVYEYEGLTMGQKYAKKSETCIKSYCVTWELNETSSSAKEMIQWINTDVENGKLDSLIAQTYIENLNQIIKLTYNE